MANNGTRYHSTKHGPKLWFIWDNEIHEIIAEAYTEHDATRIVNALEFAAMVATSLRIVEGEDEVS